MEAVDRAACTGTADRARLGVYPLLSELVDQEEYRFVHDKAQLGGARTRIGGRGVSGVLPGHSQADPVIAEGKRVRPSPKVTASMPSTRVQKSIVAS